MEASERASNRLETVRSVEPLVSAMRNISLGNWQRALNRRGEVEVFLRRLRQLLSSLLPHLPRSRRRDRPAQQAEVRNVTLVIGTERGLVGQFNRSLVQRLSSLVKQNQATATPVDVWALGGRLNRILAQEGFDTCQSFALSGSALPSYQLALRLTRRLLDDFQEGRLNQAAVLLQRQVSQSQYSPALVSLVPPLLRADQVEPNQEPWPPLIVEGDPLSLYGRIVEQYCATALYDCLLESAAAEHASRYRLMEEASQNTARLIEELTWSIQAARREAITREMQELAVGAGMIPAP